MPKRSYNQTVDWAQSSGVANVVVYGDRVISGHHELPHTPGDNRVTQPYHYVGENKELAAEQWYLRRSNYIRYTNSDMKRFNPCVHIDRVWDTLGANNSVFEYLFAVVGPNWCGYPNCTLESVETQTRSYRVPSVLTPNLLCFNANDPSLREDGWISQSPYREAKLTMLNQMAISAMIPKLDDGFSLPNFLFELVELKSMLESVLSLLKNFPRALRYALSHKASASSSGWLSAIYGWVPLVSDIRTIWNKLVNLRTKVWNFIENANKRMTLHYQHALSPETFCDPSWLATTIPCRFDTYGLDQRLSAGDISVPMTALVENEIVDPTFHATLDFAYYVPVIDDLAGRMSAALDIFGINADPSTIWAAIPFSFVVDWFVDVSSWLSRFKVTNLPIDVVIFDYCYSVKYRRKQSIKYSLASSGVVLRDVPVDTTPIDRWSIPVNAASPTVGTNAFYRWVGLPDLSQPTNGLFRTPKGLSLVNGTALAVQRLYRRRR